MKILKYNICTSFNRGTEEAPQWEEVISAVTMTYNEVNEKIAMRESYNGEYIIEDDGVEKRIEPTAQDDTDAILIDHEYRLTLLELGLVE